MNAINEEPEHREIEALLPWHAAGTLSPRDANRVEQALAGDRELARQYELVREELIETIHLNETLGAPSARGRGALVAGARRGGGAAPAPPRLVRPRQPHLWVPVEPYSAHACLVRNRRRRCDLGASGRDCRSCG